jgi:hypothetical protein
MRYLNRQYHKMSCAAVALVNIFKRVGFKGMTYRTVVDMRDAGLWDAEDGMFEDEFLEALKMHGVRWKKINPKNLYKALDRGNWVLAVKDNGPHCEQHAYIIMENRKTLNGPKKCGNIKLSYEIFVGE